MQAAAKAQSPSSSRSVALGLAAAALLLAVTAIAGPPARATGGATAKFAIGHFACYPAKLAGGTKPNVKLTNQFGEISAHVGPASGLCAPARKNASPMVNPAAHLTCYRLSEATGTNGVKLVEITNQFGTEQLSVVLNPPQSLCLPSSKTTIASTAAPGAVPTTIDHYLCYTVKANTAFDQRTAKVSDQFGTSKDTVLQPARLCVPTSKNGGHILSQQTHLLCYSVKSAAKGVSVVVRNQFGLLRGALGVRNALCLPSTKKVLQ